MTRKRPYTRPRVPPPMRLTGRDRAILEAIHAFDGMLSLKQIDRLFFSGDGKTQPRHRLRTLFTNGFVQMPDARTIHHVPLGETIYWLGEKGAEVVAESYGTTLSEISWRRNPRWAQLEHDLAVNDFRLWVQRACAADPQLELRQWVPETDFLAYPDTVEFNDERGQKRKRQVRPDGFFLIARPRPDRAKPEGFAFLLEIDMATHSNPSFEHHKVRAGLAYLDGEAYRQRFGLRFGRWLVVTTTQQRLDHLLAQTEKAGGSQAFYFTTFERVKDSALAEPTWLVAGSRELTRLIPNVTVELPNRRAN
jgi:hypothetical protein